MTQVNLQSEKDLKVGRFLNELGAMLREQEVPRDHEKFPEHRAVHGNLTRFRRRALLTTDTEDRLRAAAAMIGLSSQPKAG